MSVSILRRLMFLLWLSANVAVADTPAFPGAEGFGALASGGRRGDVYHVVNLSSSDTTVGSFAYGIKNAQATGRTIVFDVSGYIPVSGNLNVAQPNLTIAGQTAPGDGVGLKGGTFWIEKTNIILRHFRFRNGVSADCLDMSVLTTNVIIDHCDTLFGADENFSSFNSPPENLTFQWSFNAWGLEPHSAGGLWYVNHATAHHTLWAHNHTRDPKALPSGLLDWINNVTFDYGIGFILADSTGTADYKANVEHSYFLCPPGNTRPYGLSRSSVDTNGVPNFSLWLTNCLWDTDGDYVLDGYDHGTGILSVTPGSLRLMTNAFMRTAGIPVTPDPPLVAYKKIVSQAGPLRLDANHPGGLRDEVATELIRSLLVQRHDDFSNVVQTAASNGGYGTLNSTPAPLDTDRDGMPDFWEIALGSNPNLDDHTNQVAAGAFITNTPAGYTLLEEFLHFKASPHAVLAKSLADNLTSQDVDLRAYTSGFTNKAPLSYAIANVSTGAVTLVGGNVAHFVPPTNYFGRASFDFTVTDGDTNSWTQKFLLLVTSNASPRNLIWKGDGAANLWNTSAVNFQAATNAVAFLDGDNVTFDDTGTNNLPVNLVGSLSPDLLLVNATKNFTFGGSGSLVGNFTLTKMGAGTLTLNISNNFSGGLVVTNSTVTLGNVYGAGSGTVTLNNGAVFSANGTSPANAIVVAAGATATMNNNGISPGFGGVITSADGTSVLTINNTSLSAGTDQLDGFNGTVNIGANGVRFSASGNNGGTNTTFNLIGTLFTRNAGSTENIGAMTGTGTLQGASGSSPGAATIFIGTKNIDSTFNGVISENSASSHTSIYKVGTGTLILAGICTNTGTTTISNGTLQVNGSLYTNSVTVAGGTLSGVGVINGPVSVLAGGTISPGTNNAAGGTLTVSNNLTLAAGSVTSFSLGTNSDRIAVKGNLTLGGTLNATNFGGLVAGTNTLFTYTGTLSGSLALGAVPAGYKFAVATNVAGQVNLQVGKPVIVTTSIVSTNFIFTGTGGIATSNYYVLTATNLALPVASWTRLATNPFGLGGSFSFTNGMSGKQNQFYLIQFP